MSIFKQFPKTFWVANTIELFERWAWYGLFMLFANYLTGSTDKGALGFSHEEKSLILAVGTGILYLLPIVTGTIADKYGYKKVLFISFIIYTTAFIIFPSVTSVSGVFFMYLYLAIGAALFKPIISATIAKTTTEKTKSIGFGIFYMMVNIGAFFGPMVTLLFKKSYDLVFYISAGIIAFNFILLLFYKEPEREIKKEPLKDALASVFMNIFKAIKDLKFVIFLAIVAGFWAMYYQLFYTLPVFISQWVDTSGMYQFFAEYMPFIAKNYSHDGQMESEFIANFDALYIILLQIVISRLVMKWRALSTMITGIVVCSIGMALTLFTQNVMFTLTAILLFGIGEMASSPKITEYISLIAPKDKVALYMGCSFLPVFLGSTLAGIISGPVYTNMSDKISLLKQEVLARGLDIPSITKEFTQTDYINKACELIGVNKHELTKMLWDKYSPSDIWYVILAVGLFAALSLFIYDKNLRKKNA